MAANQLDGRLSRPVSTISLTADLLSRDRRRFSSDCGNTEVRIITGDSVITRCHARFQRNVALDSGSPSAVPANTETANHTFSEQCFANTSFGKISVHFYFGVKSTELYFQIPGRVSYFLRMKDLHSTEIIPDARLLRTIRPRRNSVSSGNESLPK